MERESWESPEKLMRPTPRSEISKGGSSGQNRLGDWLRKVTVRVPVCEKHTVHISLIIY